MIAQESARKLEFSVRRLPGGGYEAVYRNAEPDLPEMRRLARLFRRANVPVSLRRGCIVEFDEERRPSKRVDVLEIGSFELWTGGWIEGLSIDLLEAIERLGLSTCTNVTVDFQKREFEVEVWHTNAKIFPLVRAVGTSRVEATIGAALAVERMTRSWRWSARAGLPRLFRWRLP